MYTGSVAGPQPSNIPAIYFLFFNQEGELVDPPGHVQIDALMNREFKPLGTVPIGNEFLGHSQFSPIQEMRYRIYMVHEDKIVSDIVECNAIARPAFREQGKPHSFFTVTFREKIEDEPTASPRVAALVRLQAIAYRLRDSARELDELVKLVG